MDLTVTLSARGFRGVYESGALDFLLFALESAAASGVRVRLSRLLCAHTGCVTGVLATSSLTAAHLPLPASFDESSRLPGPNALYHAWVDLPLPHNWATRALHEAVSAALAHVPQVVLASAGPPVRRLPGFARALVVALSRGELSDAPGELVAGIEGAMARGRSAAGASGTGRSRLSYGRPKPRDASFLVLDDARAHRGTRGAPALSVYTSSLRVEQSWARFRNLAVNAATAPEILAAVLGACRPGLGEFLSPDSLFRSVARANGGWREKLLTDTPRIAEAEGAGPLPPRMRWPGAGSFGIGSTSEMTASSDMPGDSMFGALSEEDEEEEDDDEDEAPEEWINVVLHIETADETEADKPAGGPSNLRSNHAGASPVDSERAYSSLSASTDSTSSTKTRPPLELTFTLRPSLDGALAPDCLATSTLGPMGAALVKSVRNHDFLLGRHNMQQFLLNALIHPETGESLLPLCGLAAKPIPPPAWPAFEPGQEKRVQRQSRRIWDKFLAEWHSAMRSTNLAPQGLTLASLRNAPSASIGFKSSLDRLSRSFLARFFYSLTSGIRRAKARRADAEEGGGGQFLEDG